MSNLKLEPCPFCGGAAESYTLDDDSFTKTLVVRCEECLCTKSGDVDWQPFSVRRDHAGFEAKCRDVAQLIWNKRTPPPRTYEQGAEETIKRVMAEAAELSEAGKLTYANLSQAVRALPTQPEGEGE